MHPQTRAKVRGRLIEIKMLLCVVLSFYFLSGAVRCQDEDYSVCDNKFCECVKADHPQWMKVSCEFDYQNELIFPIDSSLDHVTDIEVSAAHQVVFEKHALFYARNLRRIILRNCTTVHFKARSIIEISSASLRIEIVRSNYVIFERSSFATSKRLLHPSNKTYGDYAGPMVFAGISLHVERCNEVLMGGQAFSNIQDVNMSIIQNLRLAEGALQLDPKAIVSHHGPELIIDFNEVSLKELPKDTFATSAARITLISVTAETIQKGAFSATTINQLTMHNCNFGLIKSYAFKDGIFIENFEVDQSTIRDIEPNGIIGGINAFIIRKTWIKNVQKCGIDVSTVTFEFRDNTISNFNISSIRINKFNNISVVDNKFIEIDTKSFELNPAVNYLPSTFSFINNSLSSYPSFNNLSISIKALQNNYGLCHCIMGSSWMTIEHMRNNFCYQSDLNCSSAGNGINLETVRIKDFLPTCQKGYIHEHCKNISIADPKKKTVIGITFNKMNVFIMPPLLTAFAVFISLLIYFCLFGRSRYRVCCNNVKSTCRGIFLIPLCLNRSNCEMEVAGSISQLPIPHEYTEMERLNSGRNEFITIPIEYVEVLTADKATQSLPEELTKEFLETLKKKLDDPASYEEAKAVVDHLYELVKAEETCNADTRDEEENIYDLPIPPLEKRIIKKNNECVSVGTDAPSLERLLPFSPYDGNTNLCHDYFEPKDLAVHVYAEISNYALSARGKCLKSTVPDVLVGQAMPRGPFLRAMQQKRTIDPTATIKSNSSVSSNISAKMINRPLPAQPSAPILFDPCEGTSH